MLIIVDANPRLARIIGTEKAIHPRRISDQVNRWIALIRCRLAEANVLGVVDAADVFEMLAAVS